MGLSDLFIRVLCIGSVVLYAASASLITKPQVQFTPSIVSKLLQVSNNTTSSFSTTTVEDQFLLQNLSSRVNALGALFRIIGVPQQPLTIVIDQDHPVRVSIGATDVIIGKTAAVAKGQLEHAIIKAWLRQVGSSEVLNNPLRAQVYADLIVALYLGELELHDPANQRIAKFSEVNDWPSDLLGTFQLCESAWRPAELISYCSGLKSNTDNTQTSYSLRSVIGSLIWKDLSGLSLLERSTALSFLSRNIRSQSITAEIINNSESPRTQSSETLESLRFSIQAEALEIYPRLVSELPAAVTKIGMIRDNKLSLAGGFEIKSAKDLKFAKMIIESCTAPSLKQLLAKTSDSVEHILLVQNCENKRLDYSGFIKAGVASFAQQNRSVKFTYLHRASLMLAGKMIQNFDIQAALAYDPLSPNSSESKSAKFLGLDQKIFREDLGAFKVNGPIGAILWYRGENT